MVCRRRKARGSSGERGKRGSEGRGCSSPFIRAEGAPGRGRQRGRRWPNSAAAQRAHAMQEEGGNMWGPPVN
jgi:hypothetical protein